MSTNMNLDKWVKGLFEFKILTPGIKYLSYVLNSNIGSGRDKNKEGDYSVRASY
jgi:hypothetical protein